MIIGLTGSRGVLGRRIARYLASAGCEVSTLNGDVTDRDKLQQWVVGLDRIVHCAAVVPIVRVKSDPYRAAETNVLGSLNIASLAELTQDQHVTYISSSHVYRESSGPIAEDHVLEPISVYGLTKLQGEQWVQALAPRHLIIRVFSFFANDQDENFLVPSLAKRIATAEDQSAIDLANADAKRDIADADWITEICSRLILSDKVGIVNCGTGQGHTIEEIATRLAKVMGREDILWRPLCQPTSHGRGRLVADVSLMNKMLTRVSQFDLDVALSHFAAQRLQNHGSSRNAD